MWSHGSAPGVLLRVVKGADDVEIVRPSAQVRVQVAEDGDVARGSEGLEVAVQLVKVGGDGGCVLRLHWGPIEGADDRRCRRARELELDPDRLRRVVLVVVDVGGAGQDIDAVCEAVYDK